MKRPDRLIVRSVHDFFRDGGIVLASYISYSFIMAIVPFCLFFAASVGYLLGENETFYRFLSERLFALFPKATDEITGELRKLITFREIRTFSLILYGLLSFQLFAALQYSADMAFKVKKPMSMLRSAIYSLVLITVVVFLLLVSFIMASIVPLLNLIREFAPWLRPGLIATLILKYVVSFFIVFSTVVVVYTLLPRRRVVLRHAAWGGLFTALMLEAAKHAFTWYVGSAVNMGTVYGSLSAFVVFLLWVFYSSSIFLIGGELVHNLGEANI